MKSMLTSIHGAVGTSRGVYRLEMEVSLEPEKSTLNPPVCSGYGY